MVNVARGLVARLTRSCAGAVLLPGAIAGCGGSNHGRPSGEVVTEPPVDAAAQVADECAAASALEFQGVADFEPSNPNALTAHCTAPMFQRDCFYLNYDASLSPSPCNAPQPRACLGTNGQQVPPSECLSSNQNQPGSTVSAAGIPDGARCATSHFALHVVESNVAICVCSNSLDDGWGATLQLQFEANSFFDASAWDGIAFWERRGTGPSGDAILAVLRDPYTSASTAGFAYPPQCPDGGVPSLDGGVDGGASCFLQCRGDTPSCETRQPDATQCDPFGAAVGLSDDWRLVKIPFAKTYQKGFGLPSPLGHVDPSALLALQLIFSAGSWDFWIDDLAFYREPK